MMYVMITIMTNFNLTGRTNTNIFGLDSSFDFSEVILIPANWDATSSNKKGSSNSPSKILKASPQCDLFNPDFIGFPNNGIHLLPENQSMITLNRETSKSADLVIKELETKGTLEENNLAKEALVDVNKASEIFNQHIYDQSEMCIKENKLIGLIGGDHSCSHGLINALIDYIDSFSILQIDAHMDLRKKYQGFDYSHASIMYNMLENQDIKRLIQLGVREYCEEEYTTMKESKGRIKTYFDQDIKDNLFKGKTWDSICKKIINNCGEKIYLSIDMDGLTPIYSQHTGTPVIGGISTDHIYYLINQIVKAKKVIIGFDIVETNGDHESFDIIAATQLLYKIAGQAWLSHQ